MKWLYKLLISICISFAILNIVAFFYYNVPPRTKDTNNVTEYKWPSNSFYSRFTEGIAFGFINNDGYNNELDYNSDIVINNLLMGSSHAEGFNILKKDNIASRLNDITNTYTYNIGISEHTLPICISNLEFALNKYHPTNSVIIETMSISFSDDQIIESINDDVFLETYSNKFINFLQNFKFLKLAYYQFNNLKENTFESKIYNNELLLNEMLSKAKNTCDKYGVRLIIVYHPTLQINSNDVVNTNYNKEDMMMFSKECEKNGIIFINMEDDFVNNYIETKELPHGFNNTIPGVGHLNKVGHKLIAEKLKGIVEE